MVTPMVTTRRSVLGTESVARNTQSGLVGAGADEHMTERLKAWSFGNLSFFIVESSDCGLALWFPDCVSCSWGGRSNASASRD